MQGETQEGTATMTSRYKESQRLLDSQNKQVELNAEAAAKRVAEELKSTDGQGSTIMDEVNEVGPALNKVDFLDVRSAEVMRRALVTRIRYT